MKSIKASYWIFTGIMCLIFCFSATMYLLKYDQVVMIYDRLGFPGWMVYPSATLKYLGILAVLTNISKTLKEWAYAGFLIDAAAAITAHVMAGDGYPVLAIVAFVATFASRIFWGKLQPEY